MNADHAQRVRQGQSALLVRAFMLERCHNRRLKYHRAEQGGKPGRKKRGGHVYLLKDAGRVAGVFFGQ
ncbi:hypothetical protein R2TS_10540 [Enterobacter asburiae]|nr:hypothetical protein R2TS_10540 [Enterobacter asburiae]